MITLTSMRKLDLTEPSAIGRPLHLSAASGLVCLDSKIYVVADDEFHLGVFSTADKQPGHLIRLFDGALPNSRAARKRRKPDLESLVLFPAFGDFRHGVLLALGSGSTPGRRRGVLLGLDPHGAVVGPPRSVDLSFLLAPLGERFAEPNIEGAVISGTELRLFQRGNRRHAGNAIVRLDLSAVIDVLEAGRVGLISPSAVYMLDLGQIDGIPLCFTDAAALPDGAMVFSAVAEDTEDTFNDGPCVGAAIGIADSHGRLLSLHRLDRPYKVEGIDARLEGGVLEMLLVTDADDLAVPATLFSASMTR